MARRIIRGGRRWRGYEGDTFILPPLDPTSSRIIACANGRLHCVGRTVGYDAIPITGRGDVRPMIFYGAGSEAARGRLEIETIYQPSWPTRRASYI